MAGHGGVTAGGAKEPFSIGSWVHEFEIAILDTIGAADSLGANTLESLRFENEGITFFVHGTAAAVLCRRFRRERFEADRTSGGVVGHKDRSVSNWFAGQFECKRRICMYVGAQLGFVFSCRNRGVNAALLEKDEDKVSGF
jgi:hypothetical protein